MYVKNFTYLRNRENNMNQFTKSKTTLIIFASLLSLSLVAGTIKTDNPERKRSNSEAFSETVYEKFENLQEMISDENYVEARIGLEDLTKRRLNGFEEAMINQYIGWIDSSEGKYVEAANRFQNAIDSGALPNQVHFGLMHKLAEMYYVTNNNKKAIETLHQYYSEVDEIKDSILSLEANVYLKMKEYNKAISVLEKAIALADEPSEDLNLLLYATHLELSHEKEAAKVLDTLIKINPSKKDYWNSITKKQ